MAKAVAAECKGTFIAVTAADILSKWVGEAEKGVRNLFENARKRRPCVVFIDEFESLCAQRNDSGHDVSQRVLTEFLTQMQGMFNLTYEKIELKNFLFYQE